MALEKNTPLLVTGSAGFIGKNLTARLRALGYENLLLYDIGTSEQELTHFAAEARFVFHLAGVNRPKDPSEFYEGNSGLTGRLLALLETYSNPAPVLLTSSAQAGNGTDYAKSKEDAEAALYTHSKNAQSPVFAYRLPGVFGKWCRPGYNSVVATWCYNAANGLPLEVRDPAYELPLCYIDDVVDSFLRAMNGEISSCKLGQFLGIKPTYTVTLGKLADTIRSFTENRETLAAPPVGDAFSRKLYATWLSYLPMDGFSYALYANRDDRGSFTEFLRSPEAGQVSINVAKPGIVKGNHWHDTKNEKFLVVSGEAIIRFRPIGGTDVTEYRVSSDEPTVVDIPTGYTHNIENVGQGDLVTVMWASEPFDPTRPDTWFEEV